MTDQGSAVSLCSAVHFAHSFKIQNPTSQTISTYIVVEAFAMDRRLALYRVSRFHGPRDHHAEAQIYADNRYQSNLKTSLELFSSIAVAADQADLRSRLDTSSLTFSCAQAWGGSHAFIDPLMGRDALPSNLKICSKAAAVQVQQLLQPQTLQISLSSRPPLPSSSKSDDLVTGNTSFSHHFNSYQLEAPLFISRATLIKETAEFGTQQLKACMLEEPLASIPSSVRICSQGFWMRITWT